MLWVRGQFSQHLAVLGQVVQSPHLPMLAFPLQDGISYSFLMAPHPPIPSGCVSAEIQPSWATGPTFLALPFQESEYDLCSKIFLFLIYLHWDLAWTVYSCGLLGPYLINTFFRWSFRISHSFLCQPTPVVVSSLWGRWNSNHIYIHGHTHLVYHHLSCIQVAQTDLLWRHHNMYLDVTWQS